MDSAPFRPAYELYAALAWCLAAAGAGWVLIDGVLPPGLFYAALALSLTLVAWRLLAVHRIWRQRAHLAGRPVAWIDTATLARKAAARPGHVWLGWGFVWERTHRQRLHDLETLSLERLRPPWPWRRPVGPRRGSPLLHGVEPRETDIYVPEADLEGHVFVPATTGALKTRLLALLAVQAIRRTPREAVIVIDPKGDGELRALLAAECRAAGRGADFAYFHPAFPSHSVRLDVLRNWARTTEVASRIAALIPSETGNDPFSAFAWRVINLICEGLIHGLNERPSLLSIRRYVEGGPDDLVRRSIERVLAARGLDPARALQPYLRRLPARAKPSATTPDELMALVALYKAERARQGGDRRVDGLLSLFEHDREHLGKMIASLLPILTMLTAGDLAGLLSPDREALDDPRPILDGARIIAQAAVLYMGLDSLSDAVVGDAIGAVFLADLTAVAGARYNAQRFTPRINLFIDEANQVANTPFLQLLNKARGAGFRVTFFTQTVPDFIAKLGSEPKARQVLGNANTVIAGRIKDGVTAEYVMETFGRTVVRAHQSQQTTSAVVGGERDVTNFTATYGDRVTETLSERVPPEAIAALPDLEYFAALAGSRIVKGRIPLVRVAP